jgi:hypothetical protein
VELLFDQAVDRPDAKPLGPLAHAHSTNQ